MGAAELFLTLLLGILLASNIPSLAKFFSIEEFFHGVTKGLSMTEGWQVGRARKKQEKKDRKKEKK